MIVTFYFRVEDKDRAPLSSGWWQKFHKRHPDLRLRTPSLLDPARMAMSRAAVMDQFFTEVEVFLKKINVFDKPERILNIDETWDNPTQEKHKKVVIDKTMDMPYKVYGGTQEHITFTVCASADGQVLPPMITFRTLPRDHTFHGEGPANTLYSQSESGHTDTELYLDYIRHLEPFLCPQRPVVIFQDNLGAHENLELVRFCISKGIYLYNFPRKTTHLLQPMDKLFWSLKQNITNQKVKARLLQQEFISKAKIPLITRYAMDAIHREEIQSAFAKTGIYPLDRSKITSDKLVGDPIPSVLSQSSEALVDVTNRVNMAESNGNTGSILMDVFDDNDLTITSTCSTKVKTISTQTELIKSLPCSECMENEVSLHPAVSDGHVDVAFAGAFIDNLARTSTKPKKRKLQRDTSKGRCLTHESELNRLENIEQEKREKNEAAAKRKNAIQLRKKEKEEAERRKATEKVAAVRKKEEQLHAEKESKIGRLIRKKCDVCHEKPAERDICRCALSHCTNVYHKKCMANYDNARPVSFVIICPLCKFNSK